MTDTPDSYAPRSPDPSSDVPSTHSYWQHQPYRGSVSDMMSQPQPAQEPAPDPGKLQGIEVKTKFPAARIKRIMQADDNIGKVAQVTPHVVAKALELFMISLVLGATRVAKEKEMKRVTAAHLKEVVKQYELFDFLVDIVDKVPDESAFSDEPADDGTKSRKKSKRRV